jgi:hypothetical protein
MDRDAVDQSILRMDLAIAAERHGHAPPTPFRPRHQQQRDGLIGQSTPLLLEIV